MRTPHTKVITLSAAVEWRKKMRCNRWSVVATNGCFDILHAGHCDLLYRARNFGDGLVVLLNSDDSVRALKGPTRPVNPEPARAFVLASLTAVSWVVIFEGPTCAAALIELAPDVYVKSAEWRDKQDAAERAALQAVGAVTTWIDPLPGFSTTRILERGSTPDPAGWRGDAPRTPAHFCLHRRSTDAANGQPAPGTAVADADPISPRNVHTTAVPGANAIEGCRGVETPLPIADRH
ncbi:MAG: hypothetical protein A2Y38_14460 [Spirochaetes bacterium GWB1_59_5]|nr:MAG: hypothetical protein A2Y38_14460 [Spirochaetes bacterium GWB1_59_5]